MASQNSSTENFTIGVVILVVLLGICALFGGNDSSNSNSQSYSPPPRSNSTEDLLRQSYDNAGIEYNDQMIREDARAVESLNAEFGY